MLKELDCFFTAYLRSLLSLNRPGSTNVDSESLRTSIPTPGFEPDTYGLYDHSTNHRATCGSMRKESFKILKRHIIFTIIWPLKARCSPKCNNLSLLLLFPLFRRRNSTSKIEAMTRVDLPFKNSDTLKTILFEKHPTPSRVTPTPFHLNHQGACTALGEVTIKFPPPS